MTFRSYDDAFNWARTYGRDNCRPCDRWRIKQVGNNFMVEVIMKVSQQFVCYAH